MYKIDDLDHFGRGITRINNKITFVENALPNEVVELKIKNEKKNYIEATVSKYIEKSKDRESIKCPYYDNCGGCNIMHLSYLKQLEFKQNKIKNIISKYLNDDIKINEIVPSNKDINYRNKVTFQVKKNIGFYKNNTYELISIDKCLLGNEIINKSIKYLNKLDLSSINKIICRTGSNELMIIIETTNSNLNVDILKGIASSIYLKVNNEYIHVYGNKNIYEQLSNYKYIISPDSFFQVNIDVCTKLYNKIKEYIDENKNVLDLYCGTGSIGIFVSQNNSVIGIEKNKFAIMDANKNIELNNLKNIKFICGDSGKEINNIKCNPDIIIVDPPRSGLNIETINNILKYNSKNIIYVSCDPMTLVRDLKLLNNNYYVKEITPFDMFPNTYHAETLTLLVKKNN